MSIPSAQPVGAGEFVVYSDASVKGDWTMEVRGGETVIRRRRVGPAMGAWVGWLACDPATRPSIAGQAYLGHQGTQRAEYLAAIHALNAVLAHVQLNGVAVAEVALNLDNKTVVKTLVREWNTHVLTPHRQLADKIGHELSALGAMVKIELVSEDHPHHKAAHRMSRSAWNQLFFNRQWRPAEQPPDDWRQPAEQPGSTTRDDTVFFETP